MRLVILSLGLCACGSDHGGPIQCDPSSDRIGTYLAEYTTESGNCGEQPSQLVRVADPTSVPDGCSLLSADTWRNNGCTLDRSASCLDVMQHITVRSTSTTTQTDESGSHIDGTVTLTVLGDRECAGSYRVRFTRQ